MPIIREYGDSKVNVPGPISRREYSPEQLGAGEGKALSQLGEAVQGVGDMVAKRLDQENTSDITAKLTKANADLAIKLQETIRTADPGDKKVFEEYNKHVEDTLGKIGEEASTISARDFYSRTSVAIKGQLQKTAADGQADLAGVKAVQDYTTTLSSISNTVMADPTSVGLQKEIHLQAIENLVKTGQLPREKAVQLQTKGDQEIAQAAVRGWVQLDPEYAKKKLAGGEFDSQLTSDQKHQLLGEIDQAKRAKEYEAERRDKLAEKHLKKQREVTQNNFLANMQEGKLSTKDILNSNLDAFGSGSKEQFLNMLKRSNSPEEKLKTDANTMIALFDRIHLPDGDPHKLVDENELNDFFGRGLGFADLNRLRDEMQGKQTEAGKIEMDLKKQVIEIAKGKLTKSNPLTGFKDPVGDEQMQKFMVYFFDEYKQRRAKGDSAIDLLSPDSPKYLGKSISQYTRTQQQIMRDLVPRRAPMTGGLADAAAPTPQSAEAGQTPKRFAAPKAAPLPRLPNESAADYLKRKKANGG